MQYNHYGSQYSNTGVMDHVYHYAKEWISSSPMNINRQMMYTWLDGKGLNQLCAKLTATLGNNPHQNNVINFINNEMHQAAMHIGAMVHHNMQQPNMQQPNMHSSFMSNRNVPINTGDSYAGVISHNAQQQEPTYQPMASEPKPEVKEVESMKSFQPTELHTESYTAPGITGKLTSYQSGEDRFSHLKCSTDIAIANRDELISYLRDNKPGGNCIIQISYLEYMRFSVPTSQFQGVIKNLKNLMTSPGIKNMADYELISAFNDCLKDIPKGMTDKLEDVIVQLANRYINNKAIQNVSNVGAVVHLGEFSDIKEFLTNNDNQSKFKNVSGYKSRMKAILFEILQKLSEAVIDTGVEFGAESPWLGLCGNLKLPNESKLVREVYLSPDRDAISVQKMLTEKYTVVGIPKTSFVSFGQVSPKSESVFNTLVKRRYCSLVPVPRDSIEYIVGEESAGIEPVEVIVIDPIYPIPQIFVHGLTLDPVTVVVRW